jgi:SAM-dependent methyltransferase
MRVRNAAVARLGHPAETFDPAEHPLRLNLGCGFDKRPGYLNVDLQDFHDPDLVGDVRSLPQLPADTYEEILAQDVLEHVSRADAPRALAEWRRLLRPEGRLVLRTTDLMSLLRWIEGSDDADRHRQVLHFVFGTQAYDGDFHLTGFTDVVLCDELARAGFHRVTVERRDGWLWEGDAYAQPRGGPAAPGVAWSRGFHAREAIGDGNASRWSEGESELVIWVPAAAEATLRVVVHGGSPAVHGGGADATLAQGEHELTLRLAAGANRLRFRCDDRARAPADERELAFRLDAADLALDGAAPESRL